MDLLRFYSWGLVVAGRPWLFILVPLMAGALLTPFYLLAILATPDGSGSRENVIYDSPSWREWQQTKDFLAKDGERLWLQVYYSAVYELRKSSSKRSATSAMLSNPCPGKVFCVSVKAYFRKVRQQYWCVINLSCLL